MSYQDQFYTLGTVSVTSGYPVVTGTGTGWETALIKGGVFFAGGGAFPILSVDSETTLTLAIPYIGATTTGLTYAIDRQRSQATSAIAMNDRLAQIIYEIAIGNVEQLNALTFTARQILQTDADGRLKLVNLAANKVLATDNSGDVAPIDLGAFGRVLLALAAGTTAQYLQGDGTWQAKTGLPVGTATQAALNAKANSESPTLTGTTTAFALRVGQGTLVGKAQFCNNNGVYIGEIGVGTGTGDTGKMGFYNSVNGGWWFNGAVQVTGAISAGSKSFEIDHPADPYNKDLVFMSTEAPKAGVEFWGTARLVDGVAEVDIDAASNLSPGTFVALTQNAIVVSVNNLDTPTNIRAGRISDGKFVLQADGSVNDEVTWLVKAERADPFIKYCEFCDPETGILIPEREKEDA
jgi:hypothetical protein